MSATQSSTRRSKTSERNVAFLNAVSHGENRKTTIRCLTLDIGMQQICCWIKNVWRKIPLLNVVYPFNVIPEEKSMNSVLTEGELTEAYHCSIMRWHSWTDVFDTETLYTKRPVRFPYERISIKDTIVKLKCPACLHEGKSMKHGCRNNPWTDWTHRNIDWMEEEATKSWESCSNIETHEMQPMPNSPPEKTDGCGAGKQPDWYSVPHYSSSWDWGSPQGGW